MRGSAASVAVPSNWTANRNRRTAASEPAQRDPDSDMNSSNPVARVAASDVSSDPVMYSWSPDPSVVRGDANTVGTEPCRRVWVARTDEGPSALISSDGTPADLTEYLVTHERSPSRQGNSAAGPPQRLRSQGTPRRGWSISQVSRCSRPIRSLIRRSPAVSRLVAPPCRQSTADRWHARPPGKRRAD